MAKLVAFALSLALSVGAQSMGPEREIKGNVITSSRDPRVQIELPRSAAYVGADRFILYDVADCELHAWADADPQKNVQRLYWVQFEGYIPAKPDLAHTYDSPRHMAIGGLDFYVDTWVRPDNAPTQQGSDRQHIEALLRLKGFTMPAGMMYVRLVHLLDRQKRKELMIIYGEDLAPTGFSASELGENGKNFARWPGIEKGLIDRAQKSVAIRSGANP